MQKFDVTYILSAWKILKIDLYLLGADHFLNGEKCQHVSLNTESDGL